MSDAPLTIQSHKGSYSVEIKPCMENPGTIPLVDAHYLVDANVAVLYRKGLSEVIEHPNALLIEATEENKSLERIIPVIEQLVANKVRRSHQLVAIGGGIIQDITCFIASILLRGISWMFVPTTLLAQADSCIGSKSSINLGNTKNILGTFNPPRKIIVDTAFLDTLDKNEMHSGIGEILKVHAIEGIEAFDRLAGDFDRLLTSREMLTRYIRSALEIKKRFIEADEFDAGIRNIFNYGHSFGHAIESATGYAIPHGVAVSIGMDLANHVAVKKGLLPVRHFERSHPVLRKNYADHIRVPIHLDHLLEALAKDKKNSNTELGLILPVGENMAIERVFVSPDGEFRSQCDSFFSEWAK